VIHPQGCKAVAHRSCPGDVEEVGIACDDHLVKI